MLLEDASGTAATGKEKGAGLGGLAWKHSIYLMLKPARASSPSRLPQVQEPARKRPRSAGVAAATTSRKNMKMAWISGTDLQCHVLY